MKLGIFTRLVLVAAAIVAVATATLDFAVRRSWESSLRAQLTTSLTQKVELFAREVGSVSRPDLRMEIAAAARAAGARATVIGGDGVVLADSEADPRSMENHATRPEFIAALQGRVGQNTRRSHTLGIEFEYVAAPVRGGAVRLAYPLTSVNQTLAAVRHTLWRASLLAFALAIGLAMFAASRFSSAAAAEAQRHAARLEAAMSELERGRHQQAALLASLPDAVAAVTPDLRVLWSNAAFDAMAPAGSGAGSLLDRIRAPEILDAVRGALASGETMTGAGPRSATPSAPLTLQATSHALMPGRIHRCTVSSMPGGVVAVFHDLTEVERLAVIRRDFLANVSHELRTPLASIQGYAETLAEALPNAAGEPARAHLVAIQRNVERMSRLTHDLMTLTRVETGDWKLELEPQPAAELLEEAATHLRDIAEKRGHTLTIAASHSESVLADADAIHQVFTNLIHNAAVYAPPGTPIEIGAGPADAAGAGGSEGAVRFFVRDRGPGIASTHHARLFERFYRVDASRAANASMGGTGLGLAIVKHIVLNHGGRIGVDSELGKGAEFWFTLPRAFW